MSLIYRKPNYSSEARLAVTDLSCERGYNRLFSDINFELDSGNALQISGANGVGKTTLIRTIAGLNQAETGAVLWNSENVSYIRAAYFTEISYLGHKIALKDNATPRMNLEFLGSLEPFASQITVEDSLNIVGATIYADLPCFQLSAGQKQRVALARVLRSHGRLWFLDEPATALDTEGIALLEQIIETHIASGGMVVFTSHQFLALNQIPRHQLELA